MFASTDRLCTKDADEGAIDVKQILSVSEIVEPEILDNKKSVDYQTEKATKVKMQMTSQEHKQI